MSAVIPTHNRAGMLRQALGSVVGQTYPRVEVIVVDDGSTDDTRDVASEYGDRVRYIYQHHRGRSEARNAGIRASSGEYIAFLDDDDVWYPRKLELQVSLVARDPGVDVVYSQAYLVGNGARRLLSASLPPPDILMERLVASKWIMPAGASVIMVRKAVLERSGCFDGGVEPFEDWELWARIAACGGRFGQVEEPLAEYRFHQNNSMRNRELMLAGHLAALQKILVSPGTPDVIRQKRRRYLSRAWVFVGNERYIDAEVRGALAAWRKAITLDLSVLSPGLLLLMGKCLLGSRLLRWARTAQRGLTGAHS